MKVFCKLESAIQMPLIIIICTHSVHFSLSVLKNPIPQSRRVHLCAQAPSAQQPGRRCDLRSKGVGHKTHIH